jgi:alkylated DNA repair dioxygenase AlkB
MFVKTLYDISDKYNISVLDIINNTYNIEGIYNEPILKSDSSNVGIKLLYNPDDKGLAVYESNTIDDNNPTTIGDVAKLLRDAVKFDDVLSELEDEYKGKLIYGTSGLGKTTIANTTKNVIDSDNLKMQVIFEDYPNFKMERNENVQLFILRVSGLVDTISLNNRVFDKIKEKISQGYTVLTATRAFMRNADYVFTSDINNKRLLNRFKILENLEPFLVKESEAIAKSGKPVQYVTNLEDVLIKKPKVERPETTNGVKSRQEIQPGFFDYGLLSSNDEKVILDAAIKQTNEQGYPVKKGVVYAHWGNMWAVTDKGADAMSVFGTHLKRSKETTGFGKNLPKINLPSSNINHNDGGKGWYDYYPTDQNGNALNKIPQEIKDILQKKLGIDMSVYDSAIINSYGETTELTKHIDNTEDKGFAYKIPIVSISLIGDSLFNYSKPSNNPTHYLPDKEQIKLKPGQVVVFGGPSRAMAHRVLNGKSGNSIDIKNSVNSLKTERINITLRRALPLSEEEYNNWVNSNKSLSTQRPEIQQSNITSVANIPQNKVSGIESYGSTVTANDEVIKILGKNPHSIDMIETGLRTRTTRSESEMFKYNIKVGDIIKHFGISADGTTKNILAKVIAIYPKGSIGWKITWNKEGWRAEDVNVLDKFKDGAAAIEFEVIKPITQQPTDTNKYDEGSAFNKECLI